MNKALDKALVEDFPILYRDRYGDVKETCMAWGFEVRDGWEPVIRRLSAMLEGLNRTGLCTITAVQVKEKFGGLRFYCGVEHTDEIKWWLSDLVDAAIRWAEAECARMCEECGEPGVRRPGGWVKTLCDEHAKGPA